MHSKETDQKNELNCILELEDDVGRVTRQQMFTSFRKER